jgi:uncharacterized membrane protein YozB (DUF420 family)
MDTVIVLLTLLPLLMLVAFRFARRGRAALHRNMQVATLVMVLLVVVLFELDVRLSGGKAAFLAHNPARASTVESILRFHIAVATFTFLAWLGLAAVSWPRFRRSLPGTFTRIHRLLGKVTFAGACLLSSTGALMYALMYVL